MIYLVGVVLDRTDPDQHNPYVTTPLGPYRDDEEGAIQRGADFIRDCYGTRDVRTVVVPLRAEHSLDWARNSVIGVVGREWDQHREEIYAARVREAMESLELSPLMVSMTADVSGATEALDAVIIRLGINPEDV
jgi:hypothetical protein